MMNDIRKTSVQLQSERREVEKTGEERKKRKTRKTRGNGKGPMFKVKVKPTYGERSRPCSCTTFRGTLGMGIRVWAIMLHAQCMQPYLFCIGHIRHMNIPSGSHLLSFQ